MDLIFSIIDEIEVAINLMEQSQEPNTEMVDALKGAKASAHMYQKEFERIANESNKLRSVLDCYRTVLLDLAYTAADK